MIASREEGPENPQENSDDHDQGLPKDHVGELELRGEELANIAEADESDLREEQEDEDPHSDACDLWTPPARECYHRGNVHHDLVYTSAPADDFDRK